MTSLAASEQRPKRREAWPSTALLTVTGVVGAAGLTNPFCYIQGRLWGQGLDFTPKPYAPELGAMHVVFFGIGAIWAALWLIHVLAARRSAAIVIHAVLPMLPFFYYVVNVERLSYTCNPF